MRRLAYALALISAPLAAHAGELQPAEAHKIELKGVNGVAYYTMDGGHCHVVAVLAAAEDGVPMRFAATLEPGQRFTISVPGQPGEAVSMVEIVREGDGIAVSPVAIVAN